MRNNGTRYHFIYKTTNLLTKEFYIGVHSTYNLKDGYLGSGKRLKRAILKYGEENFKNEILEFFENAEDKFKREREIVNEKLLQDPLCLNLVLGGIIGFKGGFISKEHQLKCSTAGGQACSERMKVDEELRKKFAANFAQIGRESLKKHSCDWTGRNHSEETKQKIGLANSKCQTGEGNSQYGTCWINDGVKNQKIKKDDLLQYLTNGWIKGRINVFDTNGLKKLSEKSTQHIGDKNSCYNKKWISKDGIKKRVSDDKLQEFLKNGWILGYKVNK